MIPRDTSTAACPNSVFPQEITVTIETKKDGDVFDEYYNEVVIFKVENTLFRAFKNAFLHPESNFPTFFTFPNPSVTGNDLHPSKSGHQEGTSPENPILLEGITKADFRSFLKVLSPFEGVPGCSSYEEWTGVLHLATMWGFRTVRRKAITAMPPLLNNRSIAERIDVSRKYRVQSWFIDALVEAASEPSLSRMELKEPGLDGDTICGILAMRNKVVQWQIRRLEDSFYLCKKLGGHLYMNPENGGPYTSIEDWNERNPFRYASAVPDAVRIIVMEEFADEIGAMQVE